MSHKIDFNTAPSARICEVLCERLEAHRLSLNISQKQLATDAGVSRSTLTRMADGRPMSLDSFVRVIQALDLSDHLAALLPEPGVRPVERVRQGKQRQRASRTSPKTEAWTWKDDD